MHYISLLNEILTPFKACVCQQVGTGRSLAGCTAESPEVDGPQEVCFIKLHECHWEIFFVLATKRTNSFPT